MVGKSRSRKRVYAIPRGPDGSAFEKCESCGVLVAIALADMHECQPNKTGKRFKSFFRSGDDKRQNFKDQPRSAFRFFMEEFVKTCNEDEKEVDIDRKGFKTWNNMSEEERRPYVFQAEKVNSVYNNALLKEENELDLSWVDDEADSAEVWKYIKNFGDNKFYVDCDNSDGCDIFWSETSESFDSELRARMWQRVVKNCS